MRGIPYWKNNQINTSQNIIQKLLQAEIVYKLMLYIPARNDRTSSRTLIDASRHKKVYWKLSAWEINDREDG